MQQIAGAQATLQWHRGDSYDKVAGILLVDAGKDMNPKHEVVKYIKRSLSPSLTNYN